MRTPLDAAWRARGTDGLVLHSDPPEVSAALKLTTERLVLRSPHVDMAPLLASYLEYNRSHFAVSSAFLPGPVTLEWCREALLADARAFAAQSALRLYFFEKGASEGAIVGNLAFTNVVRGVFQACHLGYRIDQRYEGKGLMYEALVEALRYAFEALGLHRVMANYRPTNERSGRLLKRLGFVIEGYARDYLFLDGAWRDHILTSLVAPSSVVPQPND